MVPSGQPSSCSDSIFLCGDSICLCGDTICLCGRSFRLPACAPLEPMQASTPCGRSIHLRADSSRVCGSPIHLCIRVKNSSRKCVPGAPASISAVRGSNTSAREVYPSVREVHPSAREVHPSAREVYPSAREVHPSAQQVHPSARQVHSSAPQIHPSAQESDAAIDRDGKADHFRAHVAGYARLRHRKSNGTCKSQPERARTAALCWHPRSRRSWVRLCANKPFPEFDIWPERARTSMLEFLNDPNATVRISRLAH